MKNKEVFFPAVYPELKNKYSKMNVLFYLADNSTYDKETGKRYIKKKDIDVKYILKKCKGEEIIKDPHEKAGVRKKQKPLFGGKTTFYRDLHNMADEDSDKKSFLLKDNGDEIIFLNDIQDRDDNGQELDRKAFTIPLPHSTLSMMYHNCNNITIKLFLYLYRQHDFWKRKGKEGFGFTISYLCEELGIAKNNKSSRQKIIYAISVLETLGFLVLGTKEKENYKSYYTKAVYTRPINVDNLANKRNKDDGEYKEPTQQQAQVMADDNSLPDTNLSADIVIALDNNGKMVSLSLQDVLGRLGLRNTSLAYASMLNMMKEANKKSENRLFFDLHKDEINDKIMCNGDSI